MHVTKDINGQVVGVPCSRAATGEPSDIWGWRAGPFSWELDALPWLDTGDVISACECTVNVSGLNAYHYIVPPDARWAEPFNGAVGCNHTDIVKVQCSDADTEKRTLK